MSLSVIVPTYNRSELLVRTLRSICNVNYRPLEVIVVDDGSTDGTADRQHDYATICLDADVEFGFIFQVNAGASAARNTGLRSAKSDFVQWVDADDTVIPEGVDALMAEATRNPVNEIVYGLVRVVGADGSFISVMGKPPSHGDDDYFDYLWHTMGAVYQRRSLHKVGGWDTSIALSDDWEFSCRARAKGASYTFVDTVVGCYYKDLGGNLTISSFHEDKCFKNIETVLSLRQTLIDSSKFSPRLQQRCFNRALIHAVELKAYGSNLAKNAFEICNRIGCPSIAIKTISRLINVIPSQHIASLAFERLKRRNANGAS